MRLICPNCDAQYEVAEGAIPAEGRDVQCSNCGHAWFQAHPDALADVAEEAGVFDPEPQDEVTADATAADVAVAEVVVGEAAGMRRMQQMAPRPMRPNPTPVSR